MRRFLAVAAAVVTAQVGAVMVVVGFNFGVAAPPAPEPVVAAPAAPVPPAPTGRMPWGEATPPAPPTPVAPLARAEPVRLKVDRLHIDTALMTLGLNPDGTVEVPPDAPDAPAGWYRNLATPGEAGPAVILGHVDSRTGPGVFYELGATIPGDRIVVDRADGSTATFTVDRVAAYPRSAFPTDEVYGPISTAGLRLVTCGGDYDRAGGGYQDNVVVFASLALPW